jgi:G8 domain
LLSTFARTVRFFTRYPFFVFALLLVSSVMLASLVMLLPLELYAATCTTTESGAWSTASVWVSGQKPQTGDTVVISLGDFVLLDESTPALAFLAVQGSLLLGMDTLFLQSGSGAFDTLVIVQGTLDADSGWFDIVGSERAVVHIETGGLFRTAAAFPVPTPGIFDSSRSPFFALDTASTFEYYSGDNTQIDVSYLLNNIFGHAYQNLTLTGMVASFNANPLAILGTFHIRLGASTTTENQSGFGSQQTVTLSGDVVNDNEGQSGAPGAGQTGCGMLSLGQDTWIFGALPRGIDVKDTIHWSGPSQMGTVIVTPNTVLSVRFVNDTVCDSLDVLTNLFEEAKPCGGHLIGRAFSEIPVTLDAQHPVDSFYGLGLTITSGTNPYLGPTRVVRTSGYLPPNANLVKAPSAIVPALRYYRITTGAGPQTGTPDEMAMQLHCDELNGVDPSALHYWRSLDQGNTWAFSGLTSYNAASDVFVWDTTVLGWPNDSGSFLWMLSDGYADTPLPLLLERFIAQWSGSNVALTWQTSSENNILGFEIDRSEPGDTEQLASYWSDDSLRSQSQYGATYHYTDASAPAGTPQYELYEITNDGVRQWLASQTAVAADSMGQPGLENVWYANGMLNLSFNMPPDGAVSVVDAIGRVWFQQSLQAGNEEVVTLPMTLPQGFYFISYRNEGGEMTKKLLVLP